MRSQILSWIRTLGLMPILDQLRRHWFGLKNRQKNSNFIRDYPDFRLPSDTIMYETYQLDYRQYYTDGRAVAEEICTLAKRHLKSENWQILDWGCGPARVVRHVPNILGPNAEIFAADFNEKTIQWCRSNIKDVRFLHNQLEPPTDWDDEIYNLIYAISVLTHLSIENQRLWMEELYRLLQFDGLLLLTTQGAAFVNKLRASEQELFKQGKPVIRKAGKEGRRTFSSFHPEPFLHELFKGFKILDHQKGKQIGQKIEQDLWILQKKSVVPQLDIRES